LILKWLKDRNLKVIITQDVIIYEPQESAFVVNSILQTDPKMPAANPNHPVTTHLTSTLQPHRFIPQVSHSLSRITKGDRMTVKDLKDYCRKKVPIQREEGLKMYLIKHDLKKIANN
jgi:hypothetical protein